MADAKANGDSGKGGNGAQPGQDEVDFKDISIPEALKILEATDKGLTEAEVARRLEQYGPNKLPESTVNPILRFLGYMWNPLSWAMEAAAIISIALLDFADFGVIIGLLMCNAVISYREEANADRAIKALTSALAPKAKALRDGSVKQIDASGLVPGDVIIVRIGDIVPADIKLLGDPTDVSSPLQVDQAALTGESLPVKKFPGHVAFSGSTIKQGEQPCVVYATGANTFFGRAAALISGTHSVANIQKVMTNIGAACLITIGLWVIIELSVSFGKYKHQCHAGIGGCPTLTNMLVVVVGGVPIAMPTVLSVTLALGAARLAKEGAIVARMSAVEEMAGMNILCSDKTGTLTLNKLSVDSSTVLALQKYSVEDVIRYSALSAQIDSEEAIDIVLVESYDKASTMWDGLSQSKFVPFNPVDKYTIAHITESNGNSYRLLKGAPQVVLRMASNKDADGKIVNEKIVDFANRGFRSLGISISHEMEGNNWEMVGLLPLFDPPRHDTKHTIEECLKKGISVKMVTGDQLLIGKEVARQLGMGSNMYTTEVLLKAKEGIIHLEGVKDVDELVEHADGFAEVFPEHKYAIVEILQNKGNMVGMTGDGVNDAPALKKADVGIAVHGATEAARGAADIVLTEPGLSTIVTAIIGARKIFQRMNTYAKYTVAMTFRICLTFGVLTCVYDWFFPTLLTVLLAVFNDGAMIALSKDRVTPSQLPNSWKLQDIFITGIVYGVYLAMSSWSLWYVAAKTPFFRDSIHLPDLQNRLGVLIDWCDEFIPKLVPGATPQTPASQVNRFYGYSFGGPGQQNPSMLEQCVVEQKWMRESMLRSLLYNQVSVSGQALVFIVRTPTWSMTSRAGALTYIAFFVAQLLSTIIALFGFNGYDTPREHVKACEFCRMSGGGRNPFFVTLNAPQAGTEAYCTDSIMGCLAYVLVAWIWSFAWHMPLDLIKWAMAYVLNEDGFRDRMHGRTPEAMAAAAQAEQAEVKEGAAPGATPALGRVSAGGRPSISRTSVQGAFVGGNALSTGAFGRRSAVMEERPKSEVHTIAGGPASWNNPTGRVSVQFGPGALERASVVSVPRPRTSVGPTEKEDK